MCMRGKNPIWTACCVREYTPVIMACEAITVATVESRTMG